MNIETAPFNYDELYTSLAAKFQAAGYDLAPGSNVSQLVSAMAYFTSMLNVNTAVNINETLLTHATQRNNILADARALGYEIQHKQSYTYKLTLTLSGGGGNYTIPKYSKFTDGVKDYYYMGSTVELTGQQDNSTVDILVIQGTLNRYTDFPNDLSVTTTTVIDEAGNTVPQKYVDVPFVDVEENGIECFITYYDDFGNLVTDEEWTKSAQFMIDQNIVLDKKFFRMDDIGFKTPRIYFQIGSSGAGIKVGTTVNINVLQTDGVNGAIADINNPSIIKHTVPNVTVSAITLVTQGTDEESLQSIKDNAPRFNNSANRAVTANDYRAICNRQSSVNDSFVWGGEDELPKSPGHIWFSFLPSNYQRTFTSDSLNKQYLLDNYTFDQWDYSKLATADISSAPLDITFNAAAKTITSTILNFADAGYVQGDTIIISGSTSNNGTYTLSAATPHVLTVSATDVLVDTINDANTITFSKKGIFENQLTTANTYYSSIFIEDTEIKSTNVNSSGQIIQPGVWDVLNNFKIPTLQFHNRHPIYLDYEYDISVLKYNIVTSKADINANIFSIIDNFFSGTNDSFQTEKFEISYFHSSLEKRIDNVLTDASGYNNTLKTSLLLTQKNVSEENASTNYRDIYIPLSVPFEPYFDANGFLLYNTLPSIDTLNFIDYRRKTPTGFLASAGTNIVPGIQAAASSVSTINATTGIFENALFTVTDDGTDITSVVSSADLLDDSGVPIPGGSAGSNLIAAPVPMVQNSKLDVELITSTNGVPGSINLTTKTFLQGGGTYEFYITDSAQIQAPGTNLYTDWTSIQTDIDNGVQQSGSSIITAPIRISTSETSLPMSTGTSTVPLYKYGLYPDDRSTLGTGSETYNKITVTHISADGLTETVLTKETDYTFDSSTNPYEITTMGAFSPLGANETLRVETEAHCGDYNVFNSFKKYITVQLYIDGSGYTGNGLPVIDYNDPKSYLTTSDQLYDFTTDSFYLTTEGYTITTPSDVTAITGPIVKKITPLVYTGSPLKMKLFRNDRYLNLNYDSPNFKVERNVISRLKRVTFA